MYVLGGFFSGGPCVCFGPYLSVFFRVFHGNSQDDILNCTREAMRSRLHFWAREIPIVSLVPHPFMTKSHPRVVLPSFWIDVYGKGGKHIRSTYPLQDDISACPTIYGAFFSM